MQILLGITIYWASLYLVPEYTLFYIITSIFSFVLMNVGFDNVSKVINVNLMKDRFSEGNKISTLLGLPIIDQLIRDYGKDAANAILTNIGNVFCGQAAGETARFMQSRMGKVLQEQQSININRQNQSSTFSTSLQYLVPEGKIATLAQGQMIGQVSDSFDVQIKQKNFNGFIDLDTQGIKKEEDKFYPLPELYGFKDKRKVLERNRQRIFKDIQELVAAINIA